MVRGGDATQGWDDGAVLNQQKEHPQNINNQGQQGQAFIPPFENWSAGGFTVAFNAKRDIRKHEREAESGLTTLLNAAPDVPTMQKDGAADSFGRGWKERPLTESEERGADAGARKEEEEQNSISISSSNISSSTISSSNISSSTISSSNYNSSNCPIQTGRGGAAPQGWDDEAVLNDRQLKDNNQGHKGRAAMPPFGNWSAGGFTVAFDAKLDNRKQEREKEPGFTMFLDALPDISIAQPAQKEGAAGSFGRRWMENSLTESKGQRANPGVENGEVERLSGKEGKEGMDPAQPGCLAVLLCFRSKHPIA